MVCQCTFVRYQTFSLVADYLIFASGFIAFTTIGYGDYYPNTPAGRSIFVVWAILGVGAMTILISGELRLPNQFVQYLSKVLRSRPRSVQFKVPKCDIYHC